MFENQISVSNGNMKMGQIPSISLPAVKTCAKGVPCAKKCYALRMEKRYKNTHNAYERNLRIFEENPQVFEIQATAAAMLQRYFRWHVSGDILNTEYLLMMIRIAKNCPNTEFLAFTKKYDIVNEYIENNGVLPKNLKIIFSVWQDFDYKNPYNLPTAHVFYKDGTTTATENTYVCGGNCTECLCRGVGCWQLKNGESIAFYEH